LITLEGGKKSSHMTGVMCDVSIDNS